MTRPKKQHGPWSDSAGHFPYRVIVEEIRGRDGALQLRWWDPNMGPKGNWRRESLSNRRLGKFIKTDRGTVDTNVAQWALERAMEKSRELAGSLPPRQQNLVRSVTIGETWDLISDSKTGKYPHDGDYRRELKRSLEFACTVWGKDTPWSSIDDEKWTTLIRARVDDLLRRNYVGVRSAEITIVRVHTAARWLRRTKKIPPGVDELPESWKDELKDYRRGQAKATRDPEPSRPRYTSDEVRLILTAAIDVDPRAAALLTLGAEQRLGQVRRAMRSDLKIPVIDWNQVAKMDGEERAAVDFGELKVIGAGKKGGTTIDLTIGQRRFIDNYIGGLLAELEGEWVEKSIDYPLFPAGKLLGRKHGAPKLTKKMDLDRPGSREWVRKNFRLIESRAGVTHMKGRGFYGIRRQRVDEALEQGISLQGLQAQGGWTSTKVPMEIYRDQENRVGRREAREIRAKMRKESE